MGLFGGGNSKTLTTNNTQTQAISTSNRDDRVVDGDLEFQEGNTTVSSVSDGTVTINTTDHNAVENGFKALDRSAQLAKDAISANYYSTALSNQNIAKFSTTSLEAMESVVKNGFDFGEEALSTVEDVSKFSLGSMENVSKSALDSMLSSQKASLDTVEDTSKKAFDYTEASNKIAYGAMVDNIKLSYDGTIDTVAEVTKTNNNALKLVADANNTAFANATKAQLGALDTIEKSTRSEGSLAVGDITKNVMYGVVAIAGLFIFSKLGKTA